MADKGKKSSIETFAPNDKANYYSRITSITVNMKNAYELKGKFLDDLHNNAFSGTNGKDAVEHIEYYLKIIDPIKLPNVDHDKLRIVVFPISLAGVDPELLTNDIMGFKTYEDYKNDWIYEWNENVPWVYDKPWLDNGIWKEPKPVKHTCKPFNYKTGCSKWPTCNLECYEALEDCELKDEALRNKAIMEGLISDDESSNDCWKRWKSHVINYHDYNERKYENETHNEGHELCGIKTREVPVCQIKRYKMIKYSFNDEEEYVVVKEDEYDDLTIISNEACRAYQEIFWMLEEGWKDLGSKEISTNIVITEYLVNISKRRAFWSLNEDILKITILKTNTPYPSRKIRRIRACTHQRPQKKEDQYTDLGSSKAKGSILDRLCCVLTDSLTVDLGALYANEHPKCYVYNIGGYALTVRWGTSSSPPSLMVYGGEPTLPLFTSLFTLRNRSVTIAAVPDSTPLSVGSPDIPTINTSDEDIEMQVAGVGVGISFPRVKGVGMAARSAPRRAISALVSVDFSSKGKEVIVSLTGGSKRKRLELQVVKVPPSYLWGGVLGDDVSQESHDVLRVHGEVFNLRGERSESAAFISRLEAKLLCVEGRSSASEDTVVHDLKAEIEKLVEGIVNLHELSRLVESSKMVLESDTESLCSRCRQFEEKEAIMLVTKANPKTELEEKVMFVSRAHALKEVADMEIGLRLEDMRDYKPDAEEVYDKAIDDFYRVEFPYLDLLAYRAKRSLGVRQERRMDTLSKVSEYLNNLEAFLDDGDSLEPRKVKVGKSEKELEMFEALEHKSVVVESEKHRVIVFTKAPPRTYSKPFMRFSKPCGMDGQGAWDANLNMADSHNYMTEEMLDKLGFVRIDYGDYERKTVKEVCVDIHGFVFLVDFVVTGYANEGEPSVIFGRDFLVTTKSKVDFGIGEMRIDLTMLEEVIVGMDTLSKVSEYLNNLEAFFDDGDSLEARKVKVGKSEKELEMFEALEHKRAWDAELDMEESHNYMTKEMSDKLGFVRIDYGYANKGEPSVIFGRDFLVTTKSKVDLGIGEMRIDLTMLEEKRDLDVLLVELAETMEEVGSSSGELVKMGKAS
ncbi:hypothetical protein Tco_1153736 [Tanacetum coccineum]